MYRNWVALFIFYAPLYIFSYLYPYHIAFVHNLQPPQGKFVQGEQRTAKNQFYNCKMSDNALTFAYNLCYDVSRGEEYAKIGNAAGEYGTADFEYD